MRILIIDYSGHPFQVQLSRALAARGHVVRHLFTSSSETPKGDLVRHDHDPDGFDIRSVSLGEPFDKVNLLKRRSQERAIGHLFAAQVLEFAPELLICANCPIETLAILLGAKRKVGARFIFWVQDLLGEATSRVLGKRLGLPGRLVGRYYEGIERKMLREADQIVAIADDFTPILCDRYRIPADKIHIIENWSPIEDVPLCPRDNDWALANLPQTPFRMIYSGTLGFKQDPALLLDLAALPDARVEVFSQGAAAEKLRADAVAAGRDNLTVRPWLPFSELPKALASGDLLVVLLEPDAGLFSVPSKVLTYMCAGRPILGSIAGDNLAARIINQAGAGVTYQPGCHAELVRAAADFAAAPDRRAAAGKAARAYAEDKFDIARVADRFEAVLAAV